MTTSTMAKPGYKKRLWFVTSSTYIYTHLLQLSNERRRLARDGDVRLFISSGASTAAARRSLDRRRRQQRRCRPDFIFIYFFDLSDVCGDRCLCARLLFIKLLFLLFSCSEPHVFYSTVCCVHRHPFVHRVIGRARPRHESAGDCRARHR